MVSDGYDTLKVSSDGDILTVTFDRPDSLNALNTQMVRDFRDCIEEIHESSAKGFLLKGSGSSTCAGLDFSLAEQDPNSDEVIEFNEIFDEGLELLQTYPHLMMYAAKGAAVGAGFIYMLESDLAVAGEETTLMLPEVKYGLYPTGAAEPLESQVGARLGKEIALTGSKVDPERAAEIGLVNDTVPEAEVDDAARALFESVTQHDLAYELGVIEGVLSEFE